MIICVRIIQVAAMAAIDNLRSQGVHVCGEDADKIYSGIFDAINPNIETTGSNNMPKSCTISRKDFVLRLLDETKHIESKGLSKEHIAEYRHAYAFDLASIIECGNPVDEFGMPAEELNPFTEWIQICLRDEA